MRTKRFLLQLFVFAGVMTSCTDEIIPTEESILEEQAIRLVKIGNNEIITDDSSRSFGDNEQLALKFASEDIYNSVVAQLSTMTTKEKMAYVRDLGLISLQETSMLADEELEKIGKESSNENEFKNKYEAYKDKYEGILIANKYDMNDLSLYVPDGDNVLTYLINEAKILVVGEEIRTVNLKNDMSNSDKAVFAPQVNTLYSRATTWYENGFNVEYAGGNKQLTFAVSIANAVERTVNVHLGAQKEMWYGWKRDTAREFYFESYLENFVYLATTGTHVVEVPRSQRYCYADCGGKIDIILGRKGAFSSIPTSGYMYVWTDLLTEKDSNGNQLYENINVWNGSQLVSVSVKKCLESKAFHVNVNI